LASPAVGGGHSFFTAAFRLPLFLFACPRPFVFFESATTGVGQRARVAICSKLGRPRLATLFPEPFPLDPYPLALGVGKSA
jgi:hypothetical protein